jgi:ketosteroid isomerase-like protein
LDNVDVIESSWTAFKKGDFARAAQCAAPNALISAPTSLKWGGTFEGPDGMRAMIDRLFASHSQLKVIPEKVLGADDNHVFVIIRATARQKGGGSCEADGLVVYELRDSSVVRAEVFLDTARIAARDT